jgi:hypothetical protein
MGLISFDCDETSIFTFLNAGLRLLWDPTTANTEGKIILKWVIKNTMVWIGTSHLLL